MFQMTTTEEVLSLKIKQKSFVNGSTYANENFNLNLNQNHETSTLISVQTYSKLNDNKNYGK
jgi:hypothetical protein